MRRVRDFYRLSQCHEGTSSFPCPRIWVSLSCLSSSIERHAEFSLSAAMTRDAWDTTKVCVDFAATPIRLRGTPEADGAGAPREEATRVGVTHEAKFEHGLRQGCRNGSKDSSSEIRKVSQARAPDSPMSGEGMKPERPDHRRRAVDVGLAAAVGSGDQGELTQRRNEVTQRAIVGNGEGVEH